MDALTNNAVIERDWHTERMAAQSHLDELRRQRGAAVLDGGTFDHRAILDAEAAVDAILAAEVEETRRQRQHQEKQRLASRQQTRNELKSALGRRTAAMKQADKAVKTLAKALIDLKQSSDEAAGLINRLGGSPWGILGEHTLDRGSYRLAYHLSAVCGDNLGAIRLPTTGGSFLQDGSSTRDSWPDADQKLIAATIAAVFPEENTNDPA